MLKILVECFIWFITIEFITVILYFISMGKLFKFIWHDIFEWHIPDHSKDHYVGINHCSVCKICGKEIMQDSQGNWF